MFKKNKYTEWYYKIISNPDNKGYTEKHHIIPRCIGGDNSNENLVKLSARQHFVCHLLLTKMSDIPLFRGKLNYALRCMLMELTIDGQRYRPKSSRIFEKCRKAHKGIPKSESMKQKLSLATSGIKRSPRTEETKQKISIAQRGKIIQLNTREKISKSLIGKDTWMKGKHHSDESKLLMSKSQLGHNRMKGRKFTKAQILSNKLGQLKRIYTIQCPLGNIFKISDLKLFCETYNLPYGRLSKIDNINRIIKLDKRMKFPNAVGWCVVSIDLK